MASPLESTLRELTAMQRKAVEWDDGPLLVLAGPGSGKTRVLTCRAARLLETSPDQRFRVLGLTFTNKAAHEMRTRIAALVPGAEERADIDTFHGFCAQLLRQHGSHCGIKPNFAIYSRTADRQAVLADALRHRGACFECDDDGLLPAIDELKKRLVGPERAASYLRSNPRLAPGLVDRLGVDRIGLSYRLYEEELVRANALDFNSLIRLAFELLGHPVLARHCRTMYRYWLIDEFQDANGPQYELLRRMAGGSFHRLFAVADDDQTLYEWNGANVRRIRSLVDDFRCEVIQLTDNFRCPPGVVDVANRLVVYNVRRDVSKAPVEPAVPRRQGEDEIECKVFSDDGGEASCIAAEIAGLDVVQRRGTVVLARSRALLEPVRATLEALNVPAALLARRDDFVSPQLRWLVACLKQINRPLDRRNMAVLAATFEDFAGVPVEVEEVIARSEANRITLLAAWFDAVRQATPSALPSVVEAMAGLASGNVRLAGTVAEVKKHFETEDAGGDLKDDLSAWRHIEKEIRQARGAIPLDQFLQEMELRSKEPPPAPNAVSLSTVHAAKGLEFDRVYLIGLAEEVFPSWYSVGKGNDSAAIEEERRSCFVAITRTKTRLILSRAQQYKGWSKAPSRFLGEMGLMGTRSNEALKAGSVS